MVKGLALAFLCYGLFSCSDAIVKSFARELPVFEIVFFMTLFSCATVSVLRPPGERWRDMFRMKNPRRVLLRTFCSVIGGLFGTYAFTTIPLAEAYSLIFLAPAIVTLLSVPFLGERVGWRRLTAVAIGFIGILLVVRPGFRELHLGHLAAALVAVASGCSMVVLRMIGHSERRVSLLGVVMGGNLVVSGILMIPEFRTPDSSELLRLIGSGVFVGLGQVTMIAAARNAPANRVAPAQYSQMAWAIVLGAIFYHEFPDAFVLAGMALICLAGLFTFLREDKVSPSARHAPLMRDRG
jgi:S-adenosylmethionine uptake transporter